MFEALSGEPIENELIRVPCRLVIRASCGGAFVTRRT
jgi:hypothetical protein